MLLASPLLLALGLFLAGQSHAIGISAGDLFVLDEFVGLVHVDAETGEETIIPTPGLAWHPKALALDRDGRHLILISHPDLIRFDPVSGSSSILTSGGYLADTVGRVSLGPAGEILFTSTRRVAPGNLDGTIVRVDRATGDQIPVHSGGFLGAVGDVAMDSHGNYFVESASAVVRIDGETGIHSFFLLDAGVTYGRLAMLPDDRLVVARTEWLTLTPHRLLTIDPSTGDSSEVRVPFFATGVVTTEQGEVYYSGCEERAGFCGQGVVSRISPDPEDLYRGIAPQAFDVVLLPEPPELLLAGIAFLAALGYLHVRRS
jgi:streptogramin lyase